jgi:hypothetical protein
MSTNIIMTDDQPHDQQGRTEPIIVELGDYSRKQIRKLRKGRGKLYDAMNEIISELYRTGSAGKPIVLVVKEHPEWDETGWPACW